MAWAPYKTTLAARARDATTLGTTAVVIVFNKQVSIIGGYNAANWNAAPNSAANPTVIDGQTSIRGIYVLGIGAGGFVVGNLLSRHQKCRDGVDKGRFPRSDVPGQQRVVAVEVKTPYAAVKGSPIEEFAAIKAHPGATGPYPTLPGLCGSVV